MTATASIQVFQCDALHVKLSRESCVTRYRFANQKRKPGTDALKAAQYEQCMGCELGDAHRRGDPTPRELLVSITPKPSRPAELHKDITMARARGNYQPKTCEKCGDMFSPGGPRTKRCDECRETYGTHSKPKTPTAGKRKAAASSPPPPPPPPLEPEPRAVTPEPEPAPPPPPKAPTGGHTRRASAVAAARLRLEAAGHRVSLLGDDAVDILVVH